MVCPITKTDKHLPFHVPLDGESKTSGVVLCDQAKIIGIQARGFKAIDKASKDVVIEVIDIINGFIEIDEIE